MSKIKVDMKYQKSTKNKHVYGELESGTAIPSIYILRNELPTKPPQSITIAIDFEGDA